MLGILGLFMAAMVWLGIRRIQGYLTLCGDVSLGVATRVSSLILESVYGLVEKLTKERAFFFSRQTVAAPYPYGRCWQTAPYHRGQSGRRPESASGIVGVLG